MLLFPVIIKSMHSFLSEFTLKNLEQELGIVFRFYKYKELKTVLLLVLAQTEASSK